MPPCFSNGTSDLTACPFFRHLWLYVIIINILLTVLLHSSSEVVIEVSWIIEHPYPRTVLSQVKLALSALKLNSVFILTMKYPLTAKSSSNNVYFCREFVGESWKVYVKPYRRKHLFGPGHYLYPLQRAQDTFSLDSVLTMGLLLKISTPDLLPLSCSRIPGKVSPMLLSPCVCLQICQCQPRPNVFTMNKTFSVSFCYAYSLSHPGFACMNWDFPNSQSTSYI